MKAAVTLLFRVFFCCRIVHSRCVLIYPRSKIVNKHLFQGCLHFDKFQFPKTFTLICFCMPCKISNHLKPFQQKEVTVHDIDVLTDFLTVFQDSINNSFRTCLCNSINKTIAEIYIWSFFICFLFSACSYRSSFQWQT